MAPLVLGWERGTQPLVAREGSLEAQVEALPAGRDGVSGGTPRCAQPGKFSAITHGTRSLFSKGGKKKPPQTHPDERSFSPVVSAGYKSSLFAVIQIMRFAAIYRPFGDMRPRRR